MKTPFQRAGSLAVVVALAVLAGCGGNDNNSPKTTTLRVLGDSLADSGTFGGVKATIGGPNTIVFPEAVNNSMGLTALCNFFAFNGTTFIPNPKAGCTNYAIGGGVINGVGSKLNAADPRIISVQMATAVAGGNYTSGDTVLIDGGGNDAAALVGAYLGAATDGGAAYTTLLATVMAAADVATAAAAGATGLQGAGATYMKGLADKFADQIVANITGKGATRVVVMNMPLITHTPRFQMVLAGVAAASGGGTAGDAARTASETLFKGWVQAFNTQLGTRFSGNANVVVYDFYTQLNNWVANPATYGYTNVKDTACPAVGVGSDRLPTYNFVTCTEANLNASKPTGITANNWFNTWLFSDGFHPTIYAHHLSAQGIVETLKLKGWY